MSKNLRKNMNKNMNKKFKLDLKQLFLKNKFYQLKKIENELIKTKIDLENQKKHELLILNTFLGFVIISLISSHFYKLALLGFGYLLGQNNEWIKTMSSEYSTQKHVFNTYYKEKFPVLFYGLTILGIGSFIGVLYSLSLMDITFQEMFSKINVSSWDEDRKLEKLTTQLYGFLLVFFSCILADLAITFYVIQAASHHFKNTWKLLFVVSKMLAVTALGTITIMTVAEAPAAATQLSQAWHTKTGLGRGYDFEIGDLKGKLSALKCQSFIGHAKFLELAQKYSKDMIITDEVLQKILNDPEIYPILKEKCVNLIDRILLGFPLQDFPNNDS